jgi:hypothetical protein
VTRQWDARRLRRAACVTPVVVKGLGLALAWWIVRGTRWVVGTTVGKYTESPLRCVPPARTNILHVTALPAAGWPMTRWPVATVDASSMLELAAALACTNDRLHRWDIEQRVTVLEIFTGRQMLATYSSYVSLQSEGLRGIAELQQIHDHCLAYEVQLQEPLPWQ